MLYTLYRRKTSPSLISNEMISEMQKHKLNYLNRTVEAWENPSIDNGKTLHVFTVDEIKAFKSERRCLKWQISFYEGNPKKPKIHQLGKEQ